LAVRIRKTYTVKMKGAIPTRQASAVRVHLLHCILLTVPGLRVTKRFGSIGLSLIREILLRPAFALLSRAAYPAQNPDVKLEWCLPG
jgi:hypothetical protein